MSQVIIEAVFEDGVLKPSLPLDLPPGSRVLLRLEPEPEVVDPLEGVIGIGKGGPIDGAEQHDHYIYGTPKR